MRRRSNLLVLLGIAFFLVGGIIVYALTNDDDDGGSDIGGPVTAVISNSDIPAGSLADDLIEEGRLEETKVPPGELPAGAVQSLNQLEGATFVQGFAEGQPITSSGLQLVNRGYEVPEGFEAMAVQVDFVAGVAGYVNAGDRLNLYAVFPGGSPISAPSPRAELLLTNVEVLDVSLTVPARRGQVETEAPRASGDSVTYLLAVRTADAEKLVYTTEFQSLYATLTADDAPPAGPTPGRDGGNILSVEPNAAAA
ncbi:MAG: Flp pilus assembly protein CpaB [Acidimicrobiales bacterium]|nr:Flp pilus assembly protein CpaB [Acidimicrobiales bacterium]